jgi:hypothetical protein
VNPTRVEVGPFGVFVGLPPPPAPPPPGAEVVPLLGGGGGVPVPVPFGGYVLVKVELTGYVGYVGYVGCVGGVDVV